MYVLMFSCCPLIISRLHYVVQAYKEILLYIHRMSESQDPKLKESAKVIMSNVFYHSEYREVFVTLFRNYYEVFQTRACLRDMVEGAHVYMKIMEAYCRENKHVIVQQTRKGGGGGKKGKRKKKGGHTYHHMTCVGHMTRVVG